MASTAPSQPETESFGFQAEVAKLLQLMVHSVYSEREVFLRELISNAADALDRRRYEALTDASLLDEAPLEIRITIDPEARTLCVSDSGIGMARADMIDNLGTIARSGSQKFVEALQAAQGQASAPELIGQFGIGFYSAFMVADRVSVTSRRAGLEEAWTWTSDGMGSFTIEPAARAAAGTTILLHMKEDAGEYLEKIRLEHIIRTWSDHIAAPILLAVNAETPTTVNSATALWTRPRTEISEQDYHAFYRHLGGLFDTPARTLHFRAEGKLEYVALLFTPSEGGHDLFDPTRRSKVKLYVKRVFITDDCDALLPPWLRFLKGVVDAQDLSLNISREMLQVNPVLAAMKKAITGKVLGDYAKLAEQEPERWEAIWAQFGRVLKEGLYEDFERRDELLKLTRFRSSLKEGWISLADYVADMSDGQEAIYYLAAEEGLATSPHLEGFTARGVNVLLMRDGIDDFWLGMVPSFEGKRFESITRAGGDLERLGEAPAAQAERLPQADIDRLIAVLKTSLGDKVKDIRASSRLVDSPACLSADSGDLDLRMQRLLKAHDRLSDMPPPVLELNPAHPLIKALAPLAGTEGGLERLNRAGALLLDCARLLDGAPLPDPSAFSREIAKLLLASVSPPGG